MENEDPFWEMREERRYNSTTATMEVVSIINGDLGFGGLYFRALSIPNIGVAEK